jgi:glutamate/tyrosine decarboxylase-like PLP-dependent enzyme/glutathione synthase/RimK-type ligase-like ATP-grasp enzyme
MACRGFQIADGIASTLLARRYAARKRNLARSRNCKSSGRGYAKVRVNEEKEEMRFAASQEGAEKREHVACGGKAERDSPAREADEVFSEIDGATLDPADWENLRSQAHRMLDDILDYTRDVRKRPVWQPIPDEVRKRFRSALPAEPTPLADVHREFMHSILPYAAGNVHPGFMGWVNGGGTPAGMLAEMLAAGMNANVGGRDHAPLEIERQVTRWMKELFGFPEGATGLFVTGTSMANFIALVIARDAELGFEVRRKGMAPEAKRLTAYGSTEVHGCIGKAMDLCGLGSDALRLAPTDVRRRIDLNVLERAINSDREAGCTPFLIVGTAGTVDTGAIDDLAGLADLAEREKLWFHVDGAYGALGILALEIAPRLAGIERADSLAFDFHKWGQVPYDAGFILVRDGALHRNAFAASSAYLRRETRGLAGGTEWPCDYGPDLSRGFRALKTWFTLKVYGTAAIGSAISRMCQLARHLEKRIVETPELELLARVELNIVCFRYRAEEADRVNAKIVIELQESGCVAPSTTILDGRLAIRAAIVNHRTERSDIERLLEKTLEIGRRIAQENKAMSRKMCDAKSQNAQSSPRESWEVELTEVEAKLAVGADSMELQFRRAQLLADLNRLAEARDVYIQLLVSEPHHLEAMRNLGNVLIAMGHRQAARTVYLEAVARHPGDPLSRVNLGNYLLEECERLVAPEHALKVLERKREARAHFEEALRVKPDFEMAHEGLSYLLGDLGEKEKASWHRREAFQKRSVIPLHYRGGREAIEVLQLVSTCGGNVRLRRFLDDRIFRTALVLPEFFDGMVTLPAHQLVVNGIGDAEMAAPALAGAETVLARTNAPVMNPPAAVRATGRSENAKRLSRLPGVVTPITVTLPRAQLRDAEATLTRHGLGFPLLLRAPGFHTGQYFVRVENPVALQAARAELPGDELIVMQYLDARGADGKTRKYRAMMIDGKIYPLHLAISSHWKIHYFTADMAENPQNRAEDAAFLENMAEVLGPVAMKALEGIQAMLGLDYAGIDFGMNAKGEVLVFEANATMAVNPPEPGEQWNYRRASYNRIHTAVQKMLIGLALRGEAWKETRAMETVVVCSGS